MCRDGASVSYTHLDTKIFRNLALAFEALDAGGNTPCVLNAANETVVQAFLEEKIGFLQMSDIIEETLQKISFIEKPDIDAIIQTNEETTRVARLLTEKVKR